MLEMVSMEKAQPFDRLRLALVGPEKSGKSRLAATGRKPVLFLDHDKRRESIAGYKDVFAITFTDPQYPNQPTSYSDTLSIMSKLESGATLKALGIEGAPDVRPRTLVTDSVHSFSKGAMAYALYANKDIRRSIKVGGQEIYVPSSYEAWNSEMSMTEQVLMRQLALGMDIIWIFHETDEEVAGSTPEKPIFSGRKGIYPVRYRGLQKNFNEVWRVSREQGNIPTVQVMPDFRFTAATNLDFSKISQNEMRPDIDFLITRSLNGK